MAQFTEIVHSISNIVVDHASGTKLYADDGREFLDFTSGIAVTSTGHCHPRVVDAIVQQAQQILHAQIQIVRSRALIHLMENLGQVLPPRIDRVYLANSGAEAIESAVRLARQSTGRQNVITFHGGFHGRTIGTASLTTSGTKVRAGVGPLMPGVYVAPFPNARHYGWSSDEATEFAIREFDYLARTIADPRDTAAILIEPILGEGGYIPASQRFLEALRQRADDYGCLLIFDEVQSGYGRTGRFWAAEHCGVVPDVIVMGKGMGSGLPIAAMAAPKEIMNKAWWGSQGGTYSGNPVACAAAVATLEVIRDEYLLENATARGTQLMSALRELSRSTECVRDIRGVGLMIGVEFGPIGGMGAPDFAAAVQRNLLDNGLLVLTCGPDQDTVRIAPPLTVTAGEIESAMSVWRKALDSVGAQQSPAEVRFA